MGCFSSPSIKQQPLLLPEQRSMYLKPALSNVREGIAGGITPYQGQRVSGPTDLQQQYFNMLPNTAQQQMQGLQGIAGSQANLDPLWQYGQRYAQDVITPNVMERFAGMGTADSGGAMKGLARELGTYGLGLNAQMAPLQMQSEYQNNAQRLQALGMMGQVPQQLGYGGAMQYDLANQQLGAQQQQWQEGQAYNNPWYNIGSSLLGNAATPVQQPGGMGYSALTGMMGNPAMGSAMGAGLGALGGLMGLGGGAAAASLPLAGLLI